MSSLRVWVEHAATVKPRVWRLAIFKELDLNDPFLVAIIFGLAINMHKTEICWMEYDATVLPVDIYQHVQ